MRLEVLAMGNSICKGDKGKLVHEMMATHPLTTTSNIVLSKSHMVDAKDWYPISIAISISMESYQSPV